MGVQIGQGDDRGQAVVVLARSATPNREMERLCTDVASLPGVRRAVFAFWEQGAPSLRQVLRELVHDGTGPILIIPLTMPTDRGFETWLPRVLHRWQAHDARPWPEIRVAPLIADHPAMASLLGAAVASGGNALDLSEKRKTQPQGSRIPPQKRCVLVCHGGSCNSVGAALIWGHLRNERARQLLAATGEGVTAAKASCLGPCALAPVVQVWPEGTYYGGVDEAATDRIISGHLLGGMIVEDIAYHPIEGRQTLRTAAAEA
jgi:(2Fe-2S) ferredoxin/sirohydrochlorin ferrochelatase